MKINTSSWHYRLINFTDLDIPNNLCAYCWKVIGAALLCLGAIVVMPIGVAVFLLPFWWWLAVDPLAVVIASLIGIAEIIGLSILLKEVVQTRRWEEVLAGTREEPTPTLFGEWLRAKHRKICPLLDFE